MVINLQLCVGVEDMNVFYVNVVNSSVCLIYSMFIVMEYFVVYNIIQIEMWAHSDIFYVAIKSN